MQEELEGLRDTLQSERQSFKDLKSELDKLKSLCDEKEYALQVWWQIVDLAKIL